MQLIKLAWAPLEDSYRSPPTGGAGGDVTRGGTAELSLEHRLRIATGEGSGYKGRSRKEHSVWKKTGGQQSRGQVCAGGAQRQGGGRQGWARAYKASSVMNGVQALVRSHIFKVEACYHQFICFCVLERITSCVEHGLKQKFLPSSFLPFFLLLSFLC